MTDKEGNSTGHLMGFIYKSLMFLEMGIKPVWIFDGIPPEEKKRELKKRKAIKNIAE
jgi:flap endonuclease-1